MVVEVEGLAVEELAGAAEVDDWKRHGARAMSDEEGLTLAMLRN